MKTFSRVSLLLLIAGTLLGDIVLASIGLMGVCTTAVVQEVHREQTPAPAHASTFIA